MKILLPLIAVTFFTATVSASSVMANHSVQYDIRIDGITCPFCVATSEQALSKIDGVISISSDLSTGTISVCGTHSLEFKSAELTKLFRKKGLTFKSVKKRERCSLNSGTTHHKSEYKQREHTQHSHE